MKTMCPSDYRNNGFAATHPLKTTAHHVPKSMSCHKTIVVITGRGHCFYYNLYIIYIYIYTIYIQDTRIYIYIYIYIYREIYNSFTENILIFIWFMLLLQRNLLYSFEALGTDCL